MFHPQNEYTIGREQCHTLSPGVATLAIIMTHTHVQSVLGHWSLSGETCVKRRSKAVWELKSK